MRNGLFVDLSHKQPAINSDRPKEMSQWLTPWGDRFVWVATPSSGLIVVSVWVEHLLARDLM